MDATYPAGPANVPADLTRPTPAYRRHAWFAMAGLASFVILYCALSGWFAWTAWHLFQRVFTTGAGGLWTFVAGACSAFLAIFMLKALFFVKHGVASEDVEITEAEQPRLFAFLHRLADDAGAPRPHRVYLSNRVNAAVFYEISIINLIFPTRKNLEIGIALVNVLSLGELKAVLAHEFGHFAQRTMYVGRWVYMGQQIAAHIIAKRDALDGFLQVLSRLDLRIAWVGWLMTLVVWSIRSVMEIVFRGVIIVQRALSREMEFQADLVAVSLTGSDALVHALHRLSAADDAWSRAVQFAGNELQQGRRVSDVFSLQTRMIEQLSRVLGQPDHGSAPPLPEANRATHRVFKAQLAQPPRMWLTHPPSSEREDNCKRRYIDATIDERSAWVLFNDEPALRKRLSDHLFQTDKPVDPVPAEESLKRLDSEFDKPSLSRGYRGCYLGRPVARHASSPAELYGAAPGPESLLDELRFLYPESLGEEIERLRELEEERAILQALQSGALTAPNGIIRHRGRELKRSGLQAAIDSLGEELRDVQDRVLDHHRRCRAAHLAAARLIGAGWPEHLGGLLQVLHYAEHSEANLLDARGYFGNVFSIVTADGKVSSSELADLITAADALFNALTEISQHRSEVTLDEGVTQELGGTWPEKLTELGLLAPTRDNISNWLPVVDSWVNAYAGWLSQLKHAALEQLLSSEAQMARFVRDGLKPDAAPTPSRVPARYTLRSPGTERKRQTKLGWWDRFHTADGTLATLARLGVAAAIVGAVIITGMRFDEGAEASVFETSPQSYVPEAPDPSQSSGVPPSEGSRLRALIKDGAGAEPAGPLPDDIAPWEMFVRISGWPRREVEIRKHVREDKTDSRYYMFWVSLALAMPEFPEMLAQRLAAAPNDVVLLRAEQDHVKGAAYRKVCERHRAMARAAPADGNLQYIASRCIPDGPDAEKATLALATQFPNNGWIAMANGFVRTRHEQWGEAFRRFQQAHDSERATVAALAPSLARLRRVIGKEDSAMLGNLMRDASQLIPLVALETGNVTQGFDARGPDRGYVALARGDLDDAVQAARSDPSTHARILRLAAASDAASPEMVREALALPADQGIDSMSAWYALALAEREGANVAPFMDIVKSSSEPEAPELLRFYEAIRKGPLDAHLTAKFALRTPENRGLAYAMAAVLRGDSAPPEWRWLASKLLFSAERPFFHVTTAPVLDDTREFDAKPAPPEDSTPGKGKRIPPRMLGVQ